MNKILIADDDKVICMLYEEELTDEGYEVVIADDISVFMEKIEEDRPDLIVLDIKLGKYNGLDLLQEIRNRYYNMPVILCTGYASFKYDLKSIAADYYVTKSSNLYDLKKKIEMALDSGAHNLSSKRDADAHEKEPILMNQIKLTREEMPYGKY